MRFLRDNVNDVGGGGKQVEEARWRSQSCLRSLALACFRRCWSSLDSAKFRKSDFLDSWNLELEVLRPVVISRAPLL